MNVQKSKGLVEGGAEDPPQGEVEMNGKIMELSSSLSEVISLKIELHKRTSK